MSRRSTITGLACVMFASVLTLICASRTPAERLPIKLYTTADGLPDHINRIVQDSRGYLWFCTSEGLSRFDGYKFTNYGSDQGLPGRDVNDFLESRSGVYWVATSEGVCRFIADPSSQAGDRTLDSSQRFVAYYPGEQAPGRTINVVCEDRAGTIWCGPDGGLFRLDQVDGQWSFSFLDIIQPAGTTNVLTVGAIIEDRQGSLWIGAESGLYRRRPDGQVERYSAEEGLLKNGGARLLLEDREGRIWVGTPYGLYQLVPEPKPHHSVVARSYETRDGLSNNWITSLCQASDGKLWAGNGAALSEFKPNKNSDSNEDGGRFQTYSPANGLTDSAIITIAEDRDRNLWMGTYVSGAMRLAVNGFTTYNQTDGLGGVSIASIFETRVGELVVAEERRLNRFDGERFGATRLVFPGGITYAGWGWYQTTFQPDAVLMDIGLPGMSGIQALQLLKERYPKMLLLMLTIYDDDERIFDAMCAGASGYLLKKTPPAKLLESLREAVAGGAPMSPEVARRVIALFREIRPPERANYDLTPHETRLLKLFVEGHNYKTAAAELGVTVHTVSFHLRSIYDKLQVHSKSEAVAKALQNRLI